jgi:hypothetical protein
MDMKKILNIVSGEKEKTQINESLTECGMGMQPNLPPTTPPVSMSVNLNAQGIDQIKDLLSLMNKADSPLSAGPVVDKPMPAMSMPTVGIDAPLAIAAPKPEAEPETDNGMDPLDAIIKKAGMAVKPKADEKEPASKDAVSKMADDIRMMTDTLANAPDEEIAGLDAAVPSGDDLHKQKGTYPKVAGGDNPMQRTEGQIKSTLMKLYQEMKEGKKSKPDFLDIDKDGNKKEPMKKAVADKKGTKEALDMNLLKAAQGGMSSVKKDSESERNRHKPYGSRSDGNPSDQEDDEDKKAKKDAKKKK